MINDLYIYTQQPLESINSWLIVIIGVPVTRGDYAYGARSQGNSLGSDC